LNAPNSGYTSEQAGQAAASAGLILTEADYAAIDGLQRIEAARLAQLATGDETGIAAAYARHFPRILTALHAIGDSALALVRTFVIAFGVPLVLTLLLIVEVQRVSAGIQPFAESTTLAQFAAISIVLANIVIELTIHYVEHKAGYSAVRAVRWSLRITARDAAYRLGIGHGWQAAELSPAQRYRRLRSITTITLLFLAVSGSMAAAIQATPGKWYFALATILTDSTLSSASVWLSGLAFSVVAILLAQGLASYVSTRVVEVLDDLSAKQRVVTVDNSAALDAIKAQYIAAKTAQKAAADQQTERERVEAIEQAERLRIENENAKEATRIAREQRKAAREVPSDNRPTAQDGHFLSMKVPSIADPAVGTNGHAH